MRQRDLEAAELSHNAAEEAAALEADIFFRVADLVDCVERFIRRFGVARLRTAELQENIRRLARMVGLHARVR